MNTAWLAGIFEGEGNVSKAGKSSYQMRITSTDKDIIERVHQLAGCGSMSEVKRNAPSHWKPAWIWYTAKRENVAQLLLTFLPFLGERRAYNALNVLDFYDGCYNCTAPN